MEAKDVYELRNSKSIAGRLARMLVTIHTKVRPPRPYKTRNQEGEVFERYLGARGRVLLLGSNLPPERLGEFRGQTVVQVDIKKLPFVDVVADAEALTDTIPPGSYDYVVSTRMLEHTPHPWKVLDEVYKVLRPGGILYVSVPWMYPLHAEPNDYWRFSVPCLQRLVREAGFVELGSGSEYSPHAALQSFLQAYLCEVFSFDKSVMFYSLEFVTLWLLYPLSFLEGALRLGPRRHYYTDQLLYIIAQKPAP